jgi:hypothetical protein
MFPHFRISNVALLQHKTATRLLQAANLSVLWFFLFLGQNGNAGAAAANRAF